MEIIDTPNPNAKKILFNQNNDAVVLSIEEVVGVASVFVGPGFITITKDADFEWKVITEDIANIFDKL